MYRGNFNRREFINSLAISSLGLIFLNPVSSFGNVIKQSNNFQKSNLLFYIDSKGEKRRVTNLVEWEIKRQQILDGMQQAMGELPDFSNLPKMDIQITDQIKGDNYTRQTINFAAAENERVPAYLYVPQQRSRGARFPAILALHETDSLGKMSVDGQGKRPNDMRVNLGYAKELAQRGYVVIAPDYPGFGDLEDYDFKTDRYQSGTMKGIFDNMRCVDLLRSRPDVDPDRIGVIGHSLGGHNAVFTAAFDKRIKVIVSSCGWTLFDYYYVGKRVTEATGGALGPWASPEYMPLLLEKYDLNVKKIPFDFDGVIAALAPRAFFSNSPIHDSNFNVEGVREGITEVAEVYHFLKAEDKLEVRYPESGHDFPPEVRFEAYQFIDRAIKAS